MRIELSLVYDGSFDGFLCCVFHAYERKINWVTIQNERNTQNKLFSTNEFIHTDPSKADRVWKKIKSKTVKSTPNTIYYAFLSEQDNIENDLFRYIKYIIDNDKLVDKDYTEPCVLKIAQTAKMVGREKHRMEAFIRFRLTKDSIYFAVAEPDFNVLPLILKHFKSRYADQKWLIYDIKRNYGIYYNLKNVDIVDFEFSNEIDPTKTTAEHFTEEEFDFQKLWLNYFNSTNIESRKNMKLHVKHVPKRYWKYLSEKRNY